MPAAPRTFSVVGDVPQASAAELTPSAVRSAVVMRARFICGCPWARRGVRSVGRDAPPAHDVPRAPAVSPRRLGGRPGGECPDGLGAQRLAADAAVAALDLLDEHRPV